MADDNPRVEAVGAAFSLEAMIKARDLTFEAVNRIAAAITPVPGGVGPMTIACLLRNSAQAAAMQAGVKSAFG